MVIPTSFVPTYLPTSFQLFSFISARLRSIQRRRRSQKSLIEIYAVPFSHLCRCRLARLFSNSSLSSQEADLAGVSVVPPHGFIDSLHPSLAQSMPARCRACFLQRVLCHRCSNGNAICPTSFLRFVHISWAQLGPDTLDFYRE